MRLDPSTKSQSQDIDLWPHVHQLGHRSVRPRRLLGARSATLHIVAADIPELIVTDAAAWHQWLHAHHESPAGVWLVLARKGTTEPTSLTYAQALDEALCYGWIDGQTGQRDDATYRQRFTPRRARSRWSARNVAHVSRLTAEGRMHPAGDAEVARARTDGRWDAAYRGSATIEVPVELTDALRAEPRAQAMFDILTSQNRYAILFRIADAKQPATRTRRIAQFVDMLARGETVYPQKRTLRGASLETVIQQSVASPARRAQATPGPMSALTAAPGDATDCGAGDAEW